MSGKSRGAVNALSEARIEELLEPYISTPVHGEKGAGDEGSEAARLKALCVSLSRYLDLLLHWNARTNLTAVRDPEQIVRRHFGEGLFAARVLNANRPGAETLLDYGSGAGFPGLPIQLWEPTLRVTLAESQRKKVAFLREVVRVLNLGTDVWAGRVEAMAPDRTFAVVTMRAVDQFASARAAARARVGPGGVLVELGARGVACEESYEMPAPGSGRVCLTRI